MASRGGSKKGKPKAAKVVNATIEPAPAAAAPKQKRKRALAQTEEEKQQSKRARRALRPKTEEENALEGFLFGASGLDEKLGRELSSLSGADKPAADDTSAAPAPDLSSASFFVEDVVGADPAAADDDEEEGAGAGGLSAGGAARRRPVWSDPDDKESKVNLAAVTKYRKLRRHEGEVEVSSAELEERLRQKFVELHPVASWAKLPEERDPSEAVEESPDFLHSTAPLTAKSGEHEGGDGRLPASNLDVLRMADANKGEPSQSVVQTVQFHPNGQLLLTAGMDKMLRFFQIDGVRNPKVQGVHLPDLPIHCASFVADGSEVIASGRRKYYYSFDLMAGKVTKIPGIKGRDEKSLENFVASPDNSTLAFLGNHGYLMLVHRKTHQWIGNLKMNGSVRGAAFSPDGKQLYSIGDDSRAYIWDVASRRCIASHADEGTLHSTTIAASPDGEYYATGSNTGIVNVYSTSNLGRSMRGSDDAAAGGVEDYLAPGPAPLKTLLNLTTPVNNIVFNGDTQLLAISSRQKKDALRMVHLPSLTVFSNWPTAQTPLHYVSAMDFSPNSGYFAVGNDRGRVLLYRLKHYAAR